MTSSATPGTPPPGHVLAAFGARETPTPLEGGRGLAWRAGTIVLKPVDTSEESLAWQRDVLGATRTEGFRVSRPERSIAGALVVEGWSATTFCVGRHEPRRWTDVIAVGRLLHRALEDVPRPAFLSARTDPWAMAERAAWGDSPLAPYRDAPHVARLEASLAPVDAPSQLIHGDLTGNVLFADPLPPAIIDLALYWRPVEYASAIVVADALSGRAPRFPRSSPPSASTRSVSSSLAPCSSGSSPTPSSIPMSPRPARPPTSRPSISQPASWTPSARQTDSFDDCSSGARTERPADRLGVGVKDISAGFRP
jgi:uncharacterized protein (TIGR02569 family)